MAPTLLYPTLATLALLPLQAFSAAEPKVLGINFVKVKRDANSAGTSLQRRAGSLTEALYNGQSLYIANVTIGSNAQPLSLQLDTGSSDLWAPDANSNLCADNGCSDWGSFDYTTSSSFSVEQDAPDFSISYGDNSQYSGVYGTDTISVGGTKIDNAIFGLVNQASGIAPGQGAYGNNGLMGISFDIGEAGVEDGDLSSPYPGFVTQLKNHSVISTRSYSLWLNDVNAQTGSILFGGLDTSKFTPPLLALPMVGTNSSDYSKIDRLAVEFTGVSLSDAKGTNSLGSGFVLPALLDSGTSITYLQPDLTQAIWDSAGAITDPALPDALVNCNLQNAQASYIFAFGGDNGPKINVSLSQLVSEEPGVKFKDGSQACSFGISKSTDGTIVLGDTFLRSAYVVYDLDNKQIAMAQTNFNGGSSNVQEISGTSIPEVSTVLPSMTLPATLAAATAAATTEQGGPTAQPTVGENGVLTLSELPGTASYTASAGGSTGGSGGSGGKSAASTVSVSGDMVMAVFGVVSLLSVLGGSTFFMLA